MKIAVCDICERKLNVDNINISYKVKARKHVFDGWSSTYDHTVDVCDRCVTKIHKLVNDDVAKLCPCGYANDCAIHCNHEAGFCPPRQQDKGNDLQPLDSKPSRGDSEAQKGTARAELGIKENE